MKLRHIEHELLALAVESETAPMLPAPETIARDVHRMIEGGLFEVAPEARVAITVAGREALTAAGRPLCEIDKPASEEGCPEEEARRAWD